MNENNKEKEKDSEEKENGNTVRDCANAGILGMKGNMLKSLMKEKPSRSASGGKREREL